MDWIVKYTKEAKKDLKNLDKSQQILVLKAIDKVAVNPLPRAEGGYGKPLGNHASSRLSGYLKIKLLKAGLRVVYCLQKKDGIMKIIIVSVRDDETVYKIAEKRTD